MSSTLRIAMLAVFAMPFAALAQSNNPAGNLGSNNSATATTPTADSTSSGMHTADAKAKARRPMSKEKNPRVAGATGRTVVPGSNSTVAGDRAGTVETKTGQTGTAGGK